MTDEQALDPEAAAELHGMAVELQDSVKAALEAGDAAPPLPETKPQVEALKETYNVMVIDDDNHIVDVIGLRLRQRGVRVTPARDGVTAMKLMSRDLPDLIVLDIVMQGMSGHEVLMKLKKDPRLATIPVIMLTGQTEQKDVVSAIYSGAIDYIIKPVDMDMLIQRIEKTLYASRHTVLIADNDHLILQLLENRFRMRGFKVLLADDGKKAWDAAMTKLPDLVVLDRMMPGLDGLHVLKNMRGEKATRGIPVIVLSARKEEHDIETARRMGANDYVIKPFLSDDLIARSINLLKK
jgi:DNA-binding response OmpR family regulator